MRQYCSLHCCLCSPTSLFVSPSLYIITAANTAFPSAQTDTQRTCHERETNQYGVTAKSGPFCKRAFIHKTIGNSTHCAFIHGTSLVNFLCSSTKYYLPSSTREASPCFNELYSIILATTSRTVGSPLLAFPAGCAYRSLIMWDRERNGHPGSNPTLFVSNYWILNSCN